MTLPISRSLATHELDGVIAILSRWSAVLKGEAEVEGGQGGPTGLPGLDYPGSDEALHLVLQQFSSELVICAGKCENLAEVIFNGNR
jgi:hypothetical protein